MSLTRTHVTKRSIFHEFKCVLFVNIPSNLMAHSNRYTVSNDSIQSINKIWFVFEVELEQMKRVSWQEDTLIDKLKIMNKITLTSKQFDCEKKTWIHIWNSFIRLNDHLPAISVMRRSTKRFIGTHMPGTSYGRDFSLLNDADMGQIWKNTSFYWVLYLCEISKRTTIKITFF